jgi:hypothetical protein
MPYDPKTVDALLATGSSRLLTAGAILNHMRVLMSQGREDEYWRAAVVLGDHLSIGGHAISEAHTRMLAAEPIFIPEREGGLPN